MYMIMMAGAMTRISVNPRSPLFCPLGIFCAFDGEELVDWDMVTFWPEREFLWFSIPC
jgi:hypothetical protein